MNIVNKIKNPIFMRMPQAISRLAWGENIPNR